MGRSAKQTLYIAPMGSYSAADPSGTGSGYSYVPTIGVPSKSNGKVQLATNYGVGGLYPTAPEAGPDAATIDFTTAWGGLVSTSITPAAAPPANDWMDILLTSAFGTQVLRNCLGVGASSTTTNLVMDSDIYTVQDLIPIYEAGLAPGRTQWVMATVDPATGQYTVAPPFATAPTTAAVGHPVKMYRHLDGGGAYVAAVIVDDNIGVWTHLAGRVMLKAIKADAGGLCTADWSIRFDSKSVDVGKNALPPLTAGPLFPQAQMRRSPLYFNNVAYDVKSVDIQMNGVFAPIGATSGVNGRSGDELIAYNPKITVQPLRTTAIEDLQRNVTEGSLAIQMGAGVLSALVLGTTFLHFDNMCASEVSDVDDQGVSRQQVAFSLADRVYQSGTARAECIQIARA